MSAIKKLPHRRWEVLRDKWLEHLPEIDFSAHFPEPTLWNLPEVREKLATISQSEEVPYVEGARESVFREVVLLARKFSYCRMVALESVRNGFPTWAVIAGYDACFYGAKAICYLLGVASLERHSKVFIDLFAPRQVKSGKTKKEVYDILVAHRLDTNLTHKMLWEIMARLCRTLHVPEEAPAALTTLRALSFDQMSNLRNNLIYDGGFWLNSDNLSYCDLINRLSDIALYRAIYRPFENPSEWGRYFKAAETLSDALVYFLEDIAKLAPAIGTEVAALKDWKV